MSSISLEEYLCTLPKGMTKDDIIKHIEEMKNSPHENNLKRIYNKVINMGGNLIIEYNSAQCYYLVGAVSTHEDYYYVVLDKDRELRFLTCAGKIELADVIPADFSVLLYFNSSTIPMCKSSSLISTKISLKPSPDSLFDVAFQSPCNPRMPINNP